MLVKPRLRMGYFWTTLFILIHRQRRLVELGPAAFEQNFQQPNCAVHSIGIESPLAKRPNISANTTRLEAQSPFVFGIRWSKIVEPPNRLKEDHFVIDLCG